MPNSRELVARLHETIRRRQAQRAQWAQQRPAAAGGQVSSMQNHVEWQHRADTGEDVVAPYAHGMKQTLSGLFDEKPRRTRRKRRGQ